jgi:hypothetical protein
VSPYTPIGAIGGSGYGSTGGVFGASGLSNGKTGKPGSSVNFWGTATFFGRGGGTTDGVLNEHGNQGVVLIELLA